MLPAGLTPRYVGFVQRSPIGGLRRAHDVRLAVPAPPRRGSIVITYPYVLMPVADRDE
jgi:hypothetical protein